MAEDTLEKRIEDTGKALKPKERAFVREYLRDLNGTQAAIRAGYAEKTAPARASRLLRMPKIKAYRDALMQERFEAIGIGRYNIAMCVWQLYMKCTQKQPVLEWDSVAHAWVPTGEWQFNVKGALKALEMLDRMLPGIKSDEDEGPSYEDMLGEE